MRLLLRLGLLHTPFSKKTTPTTLRYKKTKRASYFPSKCQMSTMATSRFPCEKTFFPSADFDEAGTILMMIQTTLSRRTIQEGRQWTVLSWRDNESAASSWLIRMQSISNGLWQAHTTDVTLSTLRSDDLVLTNEWMSEEMKRHNEDMNKNNKQQTTNNDEQRLLFTNHTIILPTPEDFGSPMSLATLLQRYLDFAFLNPFYETISLRFSLEQTNNNQHYHQFF